MLPTTVNGFYTNLVAELKDVPSRAGAEVHRRLDLAERLERLTLVDSRAHAAAREAYWQSVVAEKFLEQILQLHQLQAARSTFTDIRSDVSYIGHALPVYPAKSNDEIFQDELENHAEEVHGLGGQDIRTNVLEMEMSLFPNPVRSDNTFELNGCACCGIECVYQQMVEAIFPSRSSGRLPDWLRKYGWAQEDWDDRRDKWIDLLNEALGVEHYLERHFHTQERMQTTTTIVFTNAAQQERYKQRVEEYIENMRNDLFSDSPETIDGYQRWLFLKQTTSLCQDEEGGRHLKAVLCTNCSKT